jgi:predicted HicB family RNase H-like nuclease
MEKRVNIRLSEDAHTKAKVISVLKNITLNDYFEKAIEDAISKDKKLLEELKKKI